MTKKLPIFYSALLLTGVNLLLRLVSTGFQVYISGRIGPAGVGLLQLVLSVGSLAITAAMAGARTATMYLTAQELGKRRQQNVARVLSVCFLYSIVISGCVGIGLYSFAPEISRFWIGNPDTVPAIRLYSGMIPVICLCGVMTGYFTAANRIGTLVAVEVAEQLCAMIVTLLTLTLWAGNDPAKACQSIIFGSGISACLTLICLMILRHREKAPIGPPVKLANRLFAIALPLALADDVKAGISTTENLMVPKRLAQYTGVLSPLAAFGIVCGMVFPVMMFPAAIIYGLAELLIPELARCHAAGSKTRIRYLAKRSLKTAWLYGCFFLGVFLLVGTPLTTALYQNQEAGIALKQYAFLVPLLYCDALVDAMTKGLGQQNACVRYNILTSAMDVILLYFLLPKYGMEGYFFSFLVTHVINFILSIRRLLTITGPILDLKHALLTLVATLVTIWIARFIDNPILCTGGFLLLFFASLVLLQVITKEDVLWIKGLAYKKQL